MATSLPSCRLCQSDAVAHHFTVKSQQLIRCKRCGLVQVARQPSEEQLQAIYGETYFAHSKYADKDTLQAESDRRMDLLRRCVPARAGKRILDAGCATGDFVEAAKGEYEVYGIEYSEHAVRVAKERNPELADRLWVGNLEAGSLPDLRFDAICLWDVIEHMWDPVAVCRHLMGHLQPGGFLLFSTPAIDAPVARVMGRFWAFMTPPEHLSFLTRRSVQHLFEEILPGSVERCERKGKRANVGFLFYKLRRIFPFLVPEAAVRLFRRPMLAHWAVYVPTGDVQYVVVRKRAS